MTTLDKKDHSIIALLRQDSRLSIRDIAKKTGIRPSTVHQRLTKLVKARIIEQFTLKLNNKAMGEDFIAFLFINTNEELPKTFFKNNHIKEAFSVTGEHDYMVKLKFPDISTFNSYVMGLRKNKSITKTITIISTSVIKEQI